MAPLTRQLLLIIAGQVTAVAVLLGAGWPAALLVLVITGREVARYDDLAGRHDQSS